MKITAKLQITDNKDKDNDKAKKLAEETKFLMYCEIAANLCVLCQKYINFIPFYASEFL